MRAPILILLSAFLVGCFKRNPEFFESGNGLYGLKSGQNIVVQPRFHMVTEFQGCCAYVADDSGWAAIDGTGRLILRPFVFDNFPDAFRENRARFVENDSIGFYDSSFKVRIPAMHGFAWPFENGMSKFCDSCRVQKEGEYRSTYSENWGVMDTNGTIILPPEYEKILGYGEGVFTVVENGDTTSVKDPRESTGSRPIP